MQNLNPVVAAPITSGNAALSHSLKVVSNLSIATLIFSTLFCLNGTLAFFVPQITIFMAGTLAFFHCFWVNIPMFITSILGICGYHRGIYKHCPATAHLVFAIITAIATIGGMVILGLTLVGMSAYVVQPTIQNPNAPQIPQSVLVTAYVGAGFSLAIYIFYFYACIHGAVMYCKAPKNLTVYSNISVTPVALVNDGVPTYVNTVNTNYSV